MRTLVLAFASAAAIGCGSSMGYGSGSAAAPQQCSAATATAVNGTVELVGTEFVPACGKVAAGTAVTFTNDDSMLHTVTDDGGAFDSGNLAQGAKFTHTFTAAGTARIHCTLHAGMRMTLFVQ